MKTLVIAAAFASAAALAGGAAPSSANPAAGANLLTQTPDIQQSMSGATLVQRRGASRRGGYRPRYARRGTYRGRRYRRDRFGRYAPWIGLGILGGLAAGAAANSGPAYAAPGGDAYALCAERFRSFNPATGTYTTYGGETRLCPYLR